MRRSQVPVLRYVHPRLTGIWSALHHVDPDIVYQRTASAATGVAALFAKRHGRRFVYAAAHDLDMARDRTARLFRRKGGTRDLHLFQLGVKFADAVVVQHQGQADDCRRWYRRTASIIPSCYAGPAGARGDAKGVVLWVATLRSWKRPELFLELAKQLPRLRFRMVGGPADGPDAPLFERMKTLAATLPNVEFEGFVPHVRVEGHFDAARLFVNTSDHEGFPNTFLQAWSRGIPTVSFCKTGSTVATTVANIDEMRDTVERFMQDDALWTDKGARAASHVRVVHSADAAVDAYEQIFECWGARPAGGRHDIALCEGAMYHGGPAAHG